MWIVLMVFLSLIMWEEGRNEVKIKGRNFDNWDEKRQVIGDRQRRLYFQELSQKRNNELLRKQKETKEWIKKALNDEKNTIVLFENLGKFSIKMPKVEEQMPEQRVVAVNNSRFLKDFLKMMKKFSQNRILWTRI